MNNRSKNIVSKAEWLSKYKLKKRLSIVLVALLAILIVGGYIATNTYMGFGNFTISVKKKEMVDYGITLGTSADSFKQVATLSATPLVDATEAKADWIDELQEIDTNEGGNHNGTNYFAYTFFCINTGRDHVLTLSYSLNVKNATKNIDNAMRVKLYVDGDDKGIYGKQEADGSTPLRDFELLVRDEESGEMVVDTSESNKINKYSGNVIFANEIDNVAPRQAVRFTVVMWIEGTDPDCTTAVMGGTMRLDMAITVLSATKLEDVKL